MNEKIQKFIDLVSSKIGCGYVWGSQGETLTQQVLKNLINTFGQEHYYLSGGVSAEKWLSMQVFDCSGLIVWALRELGLIGSGADYNTDGLLGLCQRIGSRSELQPGDLVFGGNSSGTWHVGIYVGNGYTVQAEGTAIGVVKTTWDQFDSWNIYGRLNCMNGGNVVMTIEKGDQGQSVTDLQSKLNKLGYGLAVDGDFGPATDAAVKDFQVNHGLTVDGVVGPVTQDSLDKAVDSLDVPVTQQPEETVPKAQYDALLLKYNNVMAKIAEIVNM